MDKVDLDLYNNGAGDDEPTGRIVGLELDDANADNVPDLWAIPGLDELRAHQLAQQRRALDAETGTSRCLCEYCLLAHPEEECLRHHGAFSWACTAPPGSG